MTRSRRLQPALDLAERRQQEAAGELARARAALEEACGRLDELVRFRDDYRARYTVSAGATSHSGVLVKDLQVFLARLDDGIRQGARQIAERERWCGVCEAEWLRRRARARAIDKLIERRRFEEAAALLRAEQRELDELALRRLRGGGVA